MVLGDAPRSTFGVVAVVEEPEARGAASRHLCEDTAGFVMQRFQHVKHALVFILAFIGAKMILAHWYELHVWVSLVVIAVSLTLGIVASLWRGTPDPAKE